jgi:glyceraldehyde 3-phosphate dehydrogenase
MCLEDDRVEVVAISDIGRPEILNYLLHALTPNGKQAELVNNYLVSPNGKARILNASYPGQVPWDAFDVDFVVDGTGKFSNRAEMEKHLNGGAKRVIISFLPEDDIDRIVVLGVNDHTINAGDKLISPGSATTNAATIMLKVLDENFGIDYANFTAIHEYTADQPLRDVAGRDFRRSRSAAENIIPNVSPTVRWLPYIVPEMKGKVEGMALNVPISSGSLLDLNTFLRKSDVTIEEVDAAIRKAANDKPGIIQFMEDPIVSSDVTGNRHSLVYDQQATMKSKGKIVKTMSWFNKASSIPARIKEIMIAYDNLDKKGSVK